MHACTMHARTLSPTQTLLADPRINTALTFAIRLAKNPVNTAAAPAKVDRQFRNFESTYKFKL